LRPALICLLAGLVLAAAPSASWAQYKWKDSRGQVHVSDLPPPREVPDKDILQRPNATARKPQVPGSAASAPAAASPASAAASRAPVDPELDARRKKAEAEEKARQQADEARQAAARADSCQRARQQLVGLESGQRITRFNAQGERVVLDDAARNAEIDTARRAVASDCR